MAKTALAEGGPLNGRVITECEYQPRRMWSNEINGPGKLTCIYRDADITGQYCWDYQRGRWVWSCECLEGPGHYR